MSVVLEEVWGSDLKTVNMARASFDKVSYEMNEANESLIGFLARNKHASPFEHSGMTVYAEIPIFVAREWQRHRVQHYSELSQRYTKLESPKAWVPELEDMRKQVGKPGAYKFEPVDKLTALAGVATIEMVYDICFEAYKSLLDLGIAKEVARTVLPIGTCTKMYATASLRGWLNFLALRTDESALLEIRREAYQIEELLNEHFPIAMKYWNEAGRGAL